VRVKTTDREAKLLIQLGTMGNERNETKSLLREARDQCYKLRRDRLAITRAYDDVCQKLDKAMDALEYISGIDTSHAACADLRSAVGVANIALEVIE
jgi:hypothetical protein